MRIEQLMTQPAITCELEGTLDGAARLMWDHDCGDVIVVGTDGRPVGILTDRDICMAAYIQGRPLPEIPVGSAMAKRVFSCHPDESVEAAERLMSEKQIRRVPVVDGEGRPIGALSLNDIARDVASSRKEDGAHRKLVKTLAAIGEPHPKGAPPVPPPAKRMGQASAPVVL